jgi:acetoin utilization protein AcuB
MTKNVVTVHPNNPIERAALILRDEKIGGLPVIDDSGKLVGLITAIDVFDVFVEAMGMRTPGSRICIEVTDRPGAIAEMTRIIKSLNINIVSLATFYPKDKNGIREVVYRISCENKEKVEEVVRQFEAAGYVVSSVLYSDQLMVVKD